LGRLRTVEGVRAALISLRDMRHEGDDEQRATLRTPIRSPLDALFVPCAQVESVHGARLALRPEPMVEALVLAWPHNPLSSQSHGQTNHAPQQQSQQGLDVAAGLLDDQCAPRNVLVCATLDTVVNASSLGEMVHSLLRPSLQSAQGHMTQETVHLLMFSPHHRR